MRPAAPSVPVQAPRRRWSAPDVLVEPAVPEGGRDPLGLAPLSSASTTGCTVRIASSRHARVSGTSMPTRRSIAFTSAGLRRS